MSKSEISSALDVLRALKNKPDSETRALILGVLFENWSKWVINIRAVTMLLGSKDVTWQLGEYQSFLDHVVSASEWSRLCKIERDVLHFVGLIAKSMKAEIDGVEKSPDIFIIQTLDQAHEFCVFASLFYKHREIPRFRNLLKHLLSTQEKDAAYKQALLCMINSLPKVAPVIASSVMYFQPTRFDEVKRFIDSLHQPSLKNFTVIKVQTPPAPGTGKENELGC